MKGNSLNGVLLMCGSSIAFCLMAGLIKSAPDIGPFKTVIVRFMVGLGLLGAAAMMGFIKLEFKRGRLLLLRGIFGGLSIFIFFLSISKLGVGRGTVFLFSYPVFACIFSALFLKERMTIFRWVLIGGAFGGIYILTTGGNVQYHDWSQFSTYELLAITGAVLTGASMVLVKKLHDTESSYAIFFAQCLVGFWLFVVPANVVSDSLNYLDGVILLAIGVTATVGQLLMTEGYRYLSVANGSSLNMMVPVLNLFVGLMVFHETITMMEIMGSIIVIVSCVLIIISNAEFKADH